VGYSGIDFGQPDGDASENYLHMIFGEHWNDVRDNYPNNLGYVVELSVLLGDYDLDADVDGLDFLTWQRTFGADWDLEADGNANAIVDGGDLAVWQTHIGLLAETSAASLAEPTSAKIGLCLALVGIRKRGPAR
jgi:hypothetical protein